MLKNKKILLIISTLLILLLSVASSVLASNSSSESVYQFVKIGNTVYLVKDGVTIATSELYNGTVSVSGNLTTTPSGASGLNKTFTLNVSNAAVGGVYTFVCYTIQTFQGNKTHTWIFSAPGYSSTSMKANENGGNNSFTITAPSKDFVVSVMIKGSQTYDSYNPATARFRFVSIKSAPLNQAITIGDGNAAVINNIDVSADGSKYATYSWNAVNPLSDQSGNNHTLTGTLMSASNVNASISPTLGTLAPLSINTYNANPDEEGSGEFTGVLPTSAQPTITTDQSVWSDIPFGEVFEEFLAEGGIPAQLFWLPICMIFAIGLMMVAYHFTRDMLISCIVGDVILGAGIALSVLYTLPLVVCIVTSLVLLIKRKTIAL